VVVVDGVTDSVPPVALSVNDVPSLPLTVTCVALLAVTVKVEGFPAGTGVGLAVMVTVGAGLMVTVAAADTLPPAPVALAV
jgi:hypothetical protein